MSSLDPTDDEDDDLKRYRRMFNRLDINGDGQIEMNEMIKGLKRLKGFKKGDVEIIAEELFAKADENQNESITFKEFTNYMEAHEKKLKAVFKLVDENSDGAINTIELQDALQRLGLKASLNDAIHLMKSLDKDEDQLINWEEWRNFFSLYPSIKIQTVTGHWRVAVSGINAGGDLTLPTEFTNIEIKSGIGWRHLVAGGFAGALARSCTAPLDRLKIFLQVHGHRNNLTVMENVKHMIEEGGRKSLWRGNGVNLLKILPESSSKFIAYEQLKRMIVQKEDHPELHERFMAGAAACAVSQSLIYPLETIKINLAVMKSEEYKGIVDCGMRLVKKEGARGLYRGFLPNLLGIIPYAGIDLTVYENLKTLWISHNPDKSQPTVFGLLWCGAAAGSCGQFASYPLTVIRTKLQAAKTPEARAGTLPLCKHILKTEGVKGFYNGVLPNYLKYLPAASISYVLYEKSLEMLGVRRKQ